MAPAERLDVPVDIGRLDRLLALASELVVAQSALAESVARARARHGFRGPVMRLGAVGERVARVSAEIESLVVRARLVPVSTVFRRFVRLAAELGPAVGKDVDVVLSGEHTEVDKRTVDELVPPLVHLVRNAVDHGIEAPAERERAGKPRRGRVVLSAHGEGNRLVVEVRDDGGGVDVARVRARALEKGIVTADELAHMSEAQSLELVFRPGFTTAERVTDLSGRGVGLDAARHRVSTLGGRIVLESERGVGSRARIELPLTAAILDALLVEVGGERHAIALDRVREVLQLDPAALEKSDGAVALRLRDERVPWCELAAALELPLRAAPRVCVVVEHEALPFAFGVERVVGRRRMVVKAVGRRLAAIPEVVGAAIGAGGEVVLVLDVASLCAAASARGGGAGHE